MIPVNFFDLPWIQARLSSRLAVNFGKQVRSDTRSLAVTRPFYTLEIGSRRLAHGHSVGPAPSESLPVVPKISFTAGLADMPPCIKSRLTWACCGLVGSGPLCGS